MSIRIILLITLISTTLIINAQNSLTKYTGGTAKLIDDIISNIEVPRDLTKEKMSRLSQLFIYISKNGTIDSITSYNNIKSDFDNLVISAINTTTKNWKKSKKNCILMLNVWFVSDDRNNIETQQNQIPYYATDRIYENVTIIKPIVINFHHSDGKKNSN